MLGSVGPTISAFGQFFGVAGSIRQNRTKRNLFVRFLGRRLHRPHYDYILPNNRRTINCLKEGSAQDREKQRDGN